MSMFSSNTPLGDNAGNGQADRNESRGSRKSPSIVVLSVIASLVMPTLMANIAQAQDQTHPSQRKVLVVLSSAQQLELRDGKQYRTGYYLDELAIPLQKIVAAGYTPVFANPQGNPASWDPVSNDKIFFGDNEAARAKAVDLVQSFPGIAHPQTLTEIAAQGTSDYYGIFIPGGHAPMQDLSHDKALGQILVSFHNNGRPTGIICHGPTALLSTLHEPEAFRVAMIAGDFTKAARLAQGWPYAGYRLTVFSSGEEHAIEGDGRQLGGEVKFYAADALAEAGAHVDRIGAFQSNVIEDRELVSGQQPFSSDAFGDAFVARLNQEKVLPKAD
ncbi:thiamine biosynthesis protein ThiJ [Burkholderia sp. AU31652]|uniref:type 1 glutamine amidotransferase domain-containing protein n=1 Tax=Burkholderia sp. AU31652 TaxID=2015354 RepID=UPI000B7A5592|nr:type 1 glutamine amidotransferase domain-containing protein [Burkholderia sp. AU31652]OXI78264.1 thiamine biosynthesis protein ThiJ [Burkholderia sp. AU31652]